MIHSAIFVRLQEKRTGTLKDQVAAIGPQLEDLRRRKEDRARLFLEVKTEIAKICEEIAGNYGEVYIPEEKDLTLRRLDEYHGQLATLKKEKVGNIDPLNSSSSRIEVASNQQLKLLAHNTGI